MSAPAPPPYPSGPARRLRHPGSFLRERGVLIAVAVVVVLALLTGLGVLISGVGGRDDGSSSSSSPAAGGGASGTSGGGSASSADAAAAPAAGPSAAASAAPSGAGGTLVSVPGIPSRIVQTGQLTLEVGKGKVQPTLDRLNGIATGAGGFLSSARSDAGVGSPSGSSTLRVPTARYDAVVAQVRKLGTVTGLTSAAKDVTADYVDLGARISALEDTRATFLTLLSRADTIGDTLAVQQQIQPVQQQIEQLQGQQRLLANRSDLATLAVTVSEADAIVRTTEKSDSRRTGFAAAWHRTTTGFNVGLQALITILGPLLLVVLVGGAVTLGVRGLLRLRMRRRAPRPLSE